MHPIAMKLNVINGNSGRAEDYQIQGTHFPKWFLSANKTKGKQQLKTIDVWKTKWVEKGNAKSAFAPPRDVTAEIKDYDRKQKKITYKDADNKQITIPLFRELNQTNVILICPNGHLSDIPWPKYLNWKTQKETFQLPREDSGERLFEMEPCCGNPDLRWSESSTKSEGYGSVYIECAKCGLGSGTDGKPKVTLEGINSLKPKCPGHKPWQIDPSNPDDLPFEKCRKNGDKENHDNEEMQVTLVTANNTYYANGFSSLFIPMHLAENISHALKKAIDVIEVNLSKTKKSKEEYWKKRIEVDFEDYLTENDIYDESLTIDDLRREYFKVEHKNENEDFHENYRYQEYKCFSQNNFYEGNSENKGLSFKDVELSEELSQYFTKIQQVEELKVTNIQFDFTRKKPKERIVTIDDNGNRIVQESSDGQNIFSIKENELYVLPANETYGEGLFFQFNDEKITTWLNNNPNLESRFHDYLTREINHSQQGASFMQRIKNNGIKHFLIHSFSHMMMRELEFSCGYPTASLKERLYISSNQEKLMSGVLIYTAEGSEGSMGGLVSQGEPDKIIEIIKKGLARSIDCSSDPLCWESEGQGIYDLNLAACFSCSLVAETACEEMNLGLDRRVLVDDEVGYFVNIL